MAAFSLGPSSLQHELASSNNRLRQHRPRYDIAHMDVLQVRRIDLVADVRKSILREKPIECMVMIDMLQRLCIDYHFQDEIQFVLGQHCHHIARAQNGDLLSTALSFRLMRQHGYYVPADVFKQFTDGKGRFRPQLRNDARGLLALYEASQLGIEGEDMLDMAKEFSMEELQSSTVVIEPNLAEEVRLSLRTPFHMSVPKFNARQYIHTVQPTDGTASLLVELAKLDFDMSRSLHQNELKQVSMWWRDLGIRQELSFARDDLTEWFLGSLATCSDPRLSNYRVEVTKIITLLLIVDDIFDVYGTLDQMILFTEAVNRWDVEATDGLPQCMKTIFSVLSNTVEDMSRLIMKEHSWDPTPVLRKSWATLCKVFLQEARWFRSGKVPHSHEYLENGTISSAIPLVLVHLFCMLGEKLGYEAVEDVKDMPALISCPAAILRLWDDLNSAKYKNQEGYDGSFIDCFLKEAGCSSSLETADRHIRYLITREWKKLNKECIFSKHFTSRSLKASLNIAQMTHFSFNYNDALCDGALKEHLNLLLEDDINV